MRDSRAYLEFTLRLSEPCEIEEFARTFAGLGGLFDDYLREEQPNLRGAANLYVKDVRHGSIIAQLVPSIPDMIGYMDNVLIVGGFGALFSRRVRKLITGTWLDEPSKTDLKHVADAISVVAADPDGSAQLESVVYTEDGERRELITKFTTKEARKALSVLEAQKRSLDSKTGADYPKALMVFERPGRTVAKAGKPTGERAVVDAISSKALPIIYASDLAQQRIKDSFRTENVFQQGFVVDVNLERRNGRAVAYRITHLHDVIDLPDEESGEP